MHVCRIGIATGFHLVSILYLPLAAQVPMLQPEGKYVQQGKDSGLQDSFHESCV